MHVDIQVASAVVGAGAALIGAGVAGGVNLRVEKRRTEAAERAARRQDLLRASAEFTASVTSVRSLSYRVAADPAVDASIVEAMDRARVECERLRLLLESKETQKAARQAQRHAYAVWLLARDGVDPRADQYPGQSPGQRLRASLTQVYIGVRRETGSAAPQDVFESLDE